MDALKSVLDMEICDTNRLVPADDEYEVSLVSGSESHPVESLLGSRYDQDAFERVISGRYEQTPGLHLIPPDAPEWAEFEGAEFIPALEPNSESERPWNPGQELFVALRDREETVLAVLSLDAPLAGELPSEDRLVLASLVAHHAATTLEARIAESETALANREAEALADIVGSLEAGSTEDELVQHAVEGIRSVCGYHTVEVHLTATDDPGHPAWSPPVRRAAVHPTPWNYGLGDELLHPARMISRSFLVPHEALERIGWVPVEPALPGGRGRRGWHRQALLIPIELPSKEHLGFVLADNPLDRLLPTIKRVRRLEAFAMQIGLMIEAGRSLAEARIRAEVDPLTKLANRGRLYADIQLALDANELVSLVFLDLDGFKSVNDTFGHSAGDELLCHVASRLSKQVRTHSLVARFAGDEFVIASFGRDAQRISSVMQRALDAIARPFALSAGTVSLQASAGIAVSTSGSTVEQLIHEADLKMYRAKAASAPAGRTLEAEGA
ncbi:MAG: diguanylate cyclase [Gaiellales bacterium]|nr:diguanylate cyclase [Gaiellales bacterium]